MAWQGSSLYVNSGNVFNRLTKVLADGKGKTVRDRLEAARVQSYDPTNKSRIYGASVNSHKTKNSNGGISTFRRVMENCASDD
jgi:hypothetical protein